LILRRFHNKDQNILTNPEIFFKNIARFAKVANELQWKGSVVFMIDYTKLQLKIVYSQEFDGIMDSILLANQMKYAIYDNIHQIIKKIKEQDAITTQIHIFFA
jgi:hypothetical protein